MQANHDQGGGKLAALDARVTSELQHLSERLTGSVVRLDRSFVDKSSEQDRRLDEQHAHFSDSIAKLSQRWLEEWTSFDTKTAAALADGSARSEAIAAELQKDHEHFSNLCAAADRKFTDRCDATAGATAANRQQFTETIDQVVASFSNEVHSVAKQCADFAREEALKHDALSRVVNDQHEHFTRVSVELDRKYSDSTASLDRRAGYVDEQLKSLTSKIQSNAGVRTIDLDAEISTLDGLASRSRR
jgi:hypothetical protein